jgi:hypothetical protein
MPDARMHGCLMHGCMDSQSRCMDGCWVSTEQKPPRHPYFDETSESAGGRRVGRCGSWLLLAAFWGVGGLQPRVARPKSTDSCCFQGVVGVTR